MRRRFWTKALHRLSPWLSLPAALLARDLWPITRASLIMLGPCLVLIEDAGLHFMILFPFLPFLALAVSTIAVEVGLPELSHFRRQEKRPDATPQTVYYLVRALSRLQRRPWLEKMFWVKPKFHQGSLRSYLHSQLLATRLCAGQLSETESVLSKIYSLNEERGPLCHHNEAVFWARVGELERARRSVEMSRALGLKLPSWEHRLQFALLRRFHSDLSPHLLWIASVGELYQQLGFHKLALACLKMSRSTDASYRIVMAHLALGDEQAAAREIAEAQTAAPNSSWTWLASGCLQVHRGESSDARLSFERGLALHPGCRELKKAYHDLRIQLTPESELTDLILSIDESETDAVLRLAASAQAKARMGEWEASISDAMTALGMGARDVALLESLGHSWCRLGVPASGIHFLRRFHDLVELRQPVLAQRQARLDRARSVWENFDEDLGQLGLP